MDRLGIWQVEDNNRVKKRNKSLYDVKSLMRVEFYYCGNYLVTKTK